MLVSYLQVTFTNENPALPQLSELVLNQLYASEFHTVPIGQVHHHRDTPVHSYKKQLSKISPQLVPWPFHTFIFLGLGKTQKQESQRLCCTEQRVYLNQQ